MTIFVVLVIINLYSMKARMKARQACISTKEFKKHWVTAALSFL